MTLSCHVVDTGEPRNGLPTYRLPQWKPPVRGEPLVRNVADARDHLDAVIEDTDTKTSKSVVRRLRRYIAKRDCSPQEFVVVGGLTSRPTPSIWKNGTHLILARPFVDTPALSRAELETAARVTKWQHVTDALRLLREVGFIVDQWQERRGMVFRRNVTYVTEHPWLRLAMQQYQDGTPYFVLGERADPLAEMFLTPPPPAVAAGTAKVEGEAE